MQKTVSVLCKTLIRESEVSLAVLDTTALVNEAIFRHALSPVAAAALEQMVKQTGEPVFDENGIIAGAKSQIEELKENIEEKDELIKKYIDIS